MCALYLGGIVIGILVALLYRKTLFRGDAVPFVMELPNYRLPGLKNVMQAFMGKSKRLFTESVYGYFPCNDLYLVLAEI